SKNRPPASMLTRAASTLLCGLMACLTASGFNCVPFGAFSSAARLPCYFGVQRFLLSATIGSRTLHRFDFTPTIRVKRVRHPQLSSVEQLCSSAGPHEHSTVTRHLAVILQWRMVVKQKIRCRSEMYADGSSSRRAMPSSVGRP